VSTPVEPLPPNSYADFARADLPAEAQAFGPDNPPWGVGAAAFVWFSSIALMILTYFLAVIPYLFLMRRTAGEPLNEALMSDPNVTLISVASVVPAHVATMAVAWAVVTGFGKRPFWPTVGWSWPPRFRFWASAGLAILLLALGMVLTYYVGRDVKTPFDEMLESSAQALFATTFLATFTAPLVEETVYRGVLYPALQRGLTRAIELLHRATTVPANEPAGQSKIYLIFVRALSAVARFVNKLFLQILTFFQTLSPRQGGVTWAVIIVASLFTVVHVSQYYNNPAVIVAVGSLGLALTYVRARTGRLLPCFVIHLVFNGVQCAALLLDYFHLLPDAQKAEAALLPHAAAALAALRLF
jgi:membrane protease YdiL (CAAX protease family)